MNTIEIPIPVSEFEVLKREKSFVLIYPYEHPVAKAVTISSMVRLNAIEDEDFIEMFTNSDSITETPIQQKRLYELGYVRECALRDVTQNEWFKNCGPDSMSQYMKLTKLAHPDEPVKILAARKPNYSLTSFNKRYNKMQGR